MTALSVALLLSCLIILLAPRTWSGNEIVYFDLAHRWIDPERFSDVHATRDFSIARIVSFFVMGAGIKGLGMEGAYRAFGLGFLVLSPIAFLALARSMRAGLTSAALGLFLILLCGQQSAIGGEFLFGSIEPKTFAYTFVLFGLALMFSGRRLFASAVFVCAVYFHFLVGAFWGSAAFGFFLLEDRNLRKVKLPFAIFAGLSLPLLMAILSERARPDSDLFGAMSPSLNTIYAEFRNPHHIAPYVDLQVFFSDWFWGIVFHAALAVFFAMLAYRKAHRDRLVSAWIAGLNLYIILAAIIAFFDRTTHILAAFYLFRPSALILLLSVLWGMAQIVRPIREHRRVFTLITLTIALVWASSPAIQAAVRTVRGPVPLEALATPSEGAMIDWISSHTDANAVFLIEPLSGEAFMGEGGGIWAGFERLIERPTLVNYKLVPTQKADLARWYKLILWRQAVFDGGCARIDEQPVDFLIIRSSGSAHRLADCSELVWQGSDTAILRVIETSKDPR